MSAAGAAEAPDPEHRLHPHALGLLERALGYTGAVLRAVPPARIGVPTPCEQWDLEQLLAHMEDALDAFAEAAAGSVRLGPPGSSHPGSSHPGSSHPGSSHPGSSHPEPTRPPVDRTVRLERKACALLRVWSRGAPADVQVGELRLAADVLVPAAALEIAVHGWDVAQAVGGPGLDADLARALAPAAALLVPPGPARAGRFDPPPPRMSGPGPEDAGPDSPTDDRSQPARLLAWLGRDQAAGSDTTNRAPSPGAPV